MRDRPLGNATEPLAARCLFLVYSAAVSLVVWAVLVPLTLAGRAAFHHGLLGRIAARRARMTELAEWLGWIDPRPSPALRIVVHAVSAGETVSALRLVDALHRVRPEWTVIMTAGTGDGLVLARAAADKQPAIADVTRLPWDRRAAIERWLRRLDPAAVVVVEPEYWPNLFRACGRLQIPLLLAAARVYPRDVARYRLIRPLMRAAFAHAHWIGAESHEARTALIAIGAPNDRIDVTGSLKLEAPADLAQSETARRLAALRAAGATLLVAGSTHAADEAALFGALVALRARAPSLRLVVAPRHIARAGRVVAAARRCGLRAAMAPAAQAASNPWDVLVVDRLGELTALYAVADVAMVGGTWARRGGHNVAEPARLGRPVIVGPHVAHIRALVDRLQADAAMVRLADARPETLAAAIDSLLDDPEACAAMGARAQRALAPYAGAAARSADRLVAVIERRLSTAPITAWCATPTRPPLAASGGEC